MRIQIKKAIIQIEAEGCIDCGTRSSSRWFEAQIVPLTIGNIETAITLHRCADCSKVEKSNIVNPL